MGQTKPVKIIRLVSRNTVDEYMLKKMESKLKLTTRVITEGGFSSFDIAPEDSKTLSDMLLFGLSSLLEDKEDTTDDIEVVLGGTDSNGNWDFDKNEDNANTNGQIGGDVDDYYDFEGTNYREKKVKDRQTFDEIIKENVSSVPAVSNNLTSVRSRKTVNMSEADLKENEKLLEKQHKAAQEQRKAKRDAKKKETWDEVGYISTALPTSTLPSNLFSSLDVEYVVGDVTSSNKTGIVIHCTDSSGDWGTGGLFTALTRKSQNPQKCYELAKDMDDLRLGQCHVVDYFPDLAVALLVCIRRGSSSMKLDLKCLGEALTSLGSYSEQKNITVHMPRVGFSVEDWYGAERLLRKCLLSQNIPTFVYYFSKRSSNQTSSRQNVTSSKAGASRSSSSPLHKPAKKQKKSLSNSYTNKIVYLDPELSPSEQEVLKRHIVAANGDIQTFLGDNVTHILSYDKELKTDDDCKAVIINPYQFVRTLSSVDL
ncbi:chromodomain-helicase-DNA-binding protein 1-like [Bolinopsis microptera]|uniref:chromodomain-helicase-DNA-binding protein 1-like n=1 Tax=Bolinopsis microptera TaxID=2820187 RepID=UPI0030791EE9